MDHQETEDEELLQNTVDRDFSHLCITVTQLISGAELTTA